jgi:uncharacterized protein YrrD
MHPYDERRKRMNIEIGARVRTQDDDAVGEVHRVIVDLEEQSISSIVVLKGHLLSRDIRVPLEYVERADEDGVLLGITTQQLEDLPDFVYNEILTPPPTWAFPLPYPGGAVYVPVSQRERLGDTEVDLIPGVKVVSTDDAELGTVAEVEVDPDSGRVDAFWISSGGIFSHDLRIPAEWVDGIDAERLRVAATQHQLEEWLGEESRARRA